MAETPYTKIITVPAATHACVMKADGQGNKGIIQSPFSSNALTAPSKEGNEQYSENCPDVERYGTVYYAGNY